MLTETTQEVAQEAAHRGLVYSTIDLRYGNRPVLQQEYQ